MGETDVTVTGTWTYTETGKVNVTYEVTGNEKPDDSTVSNMPENTQVYKGSTVTAGSVPTTTSNSNGEKLGTWKFSGWTTTDETNNVQEDVKFTGSWTFTAYDTITVTPADITIYMGGDKGYEAVVNGSGEYITNNTLPTPLFKVKLPEGVNIEDITVSGTTSGGESRGWTFELAGKTDKGEDLYYIVPDEGQDPIRVTYTDDNGKAIVSDLFEPTAELYETYKINIYYNDVTSIFATDGTNTYVIDADDDNYGTLTVRAVDEHEENPVVGIDEPVSEPVEAGSAAITAPANTTYTLNNTTVEVDPAGVGLLFDGIIDDATNNRTQALIDQLESKQLIESGMAYQAQYLDLVDAHNGNAWVKASGDVTITWGYPAGTDKNTDFTLYHFEGLHRDGDNSGFNIDDVDEATIKEVDIDTTDNGIEFNVGVGGFSPFVLVYEKPETAVTVDKSASDHRPEVGDRVKYTLVVENTGNTTLNNVVVKDTLWESGMRIMLGDTPVTLTGDSLTITEIIPNQEITITYYYTPTWRDVGRLVNGATVTAGDATDSDTVTVIVDDGWTPNIPDDDDEDVEPEVEYTPNWLNTDDHFAYIVGYEDGSVRPTANITRAEVATIFFRLLTDEARAEFWSSENDFTDVASDAWYNNAVSTLSGMGILGGYEDGSFRPNASITRAEFVAIATRFFDYSARYEGGFTDVSYGDWYADCVQASADMGLVNGYEDGSFRPNASITRAEACAIVNRVLHRIPHEDHLLSESVMNVWPDNPKSAWYYADMQEATNSHDYDWTRESGSVVEDWTDKLPERDWSALETEWANAYSK